MSKGCVLAHLLYFLYNTYKEMLMNLLPKTVILHHHSVLIQSPSKQDGAALLSYMKQMAIESDFMVRYPEECTYTLEQEEALIAKMKASPKEAFITAFINGELVGNASLHSVDTYKKLCHRSSLGIGILQKGQGIGLGNLLMDEIIELAKQLDYEQLELSVSADNIKALSLYKKKGFQVCGRIPHGFKLKNDRYADLIMMIKMLHE